MSASALRNRLTTVLLVASVLALARALWPEGSERTAALYVVANTALGMHLYHGAWSILQSLGFAHPRYNDAARSTATAIALGTTIGFLAVPISVQLGVVRLIGG